MLDKREIVLATLNGTIGGMMFNFEDIEEVTAINHGTLMMKSGLGFIVNELYDNLKQVTNDYIEFVRLILDEVDDEYFRLMLIMLENNIPIEGELDRYVIRTFDKLVAEGVL